MPTSSFARALALLILSLAAVPARSALVIASWDSVDLGDDTATGSFGDLAVTLAGTGTAPGDLSYFQSLTNVFDSDAFAPRLAAADRLEFSAQSGTVREFTLTFGAPVVDPRIHFRSVASVITFTGGVTSITRMDGTANDTNFGVSGLVVSAIDNVNDADGTIRLDGLVSTATFTAVITGPYTLDGINIGVLADPATAVPAPAALLPFLTAFGAAATRLRRGGRTRARLPAAR
jgi:hypothetical protein